LFFSAAAQGDDHRARITKDALNPGLRNEAGEPVKVVELLEFGHRKSITRIPLEGKSVFPANHAVSWTAKAESYPLESRKNRNYIEATSRRMAFIGLSMIQAY
jgi:hypothetical protein